MEALNKGFHLGKMTLAYTTTCKDGNCTTKFTVDDKGFVDPNSISPWQDDNEGPDNELGGTPYDYQPVEWSETYKNPGYKTDKDSKPLEIIKEKT